VSDGHRAQNYGPGKHFLGQHHVHHIITLFSINYSMMM